VRVACVVGARPNLVKMAPILRGMAADAVFEPILIHTGQHYDHNMSGLFFEQLGIRPPDYNLEVGSDTVTRQTARVMMATEALFREIRPDLVLVVGDVSSTLAAALVAVRLGVRLAHVEAGLRSFDRTMPEEVNRVLTDAISDLLFTTEASAHDNLAREGVDPGRVHFVGNVMIDSLLWHLDAARRTEIAGRLALPRGEYALVTLHRPSNVDDPAVLTRLVESVLALEIPLLFPVHPRTRDRLAAAGLLARLESTSRVTLAEPLGYLELISSLLDARLVLTDSGGLQEESTVLGVPCLTLRTSTERPVTITDGTNELVGTDPVRIRDAASRVLAGPGRREARRPALWDGATATRILDVLRQG
jgi:UDP-N-acetylglucosamine 2-epimerase (non-hydrolysing)